MISVGDILNDRYKIISFSCKTFFGYKFIAEDSLNGIKVFLDILDPNFFKLEFSTFKNVIDGEIAKFNTISADNIFRPKEYFEFEKYIALISDYTESVQLSDIVAHMRERKIEFNDFDIYYIIGSCLLNIKKIQEISSHLKLLPSFVWISRDGIRFTDYYFSEFFTTKIANDYDIFNLIKGFLPPEFLEFKMHDKRSDIYTIGSILYYMLTMENPPEIMDLAESKDENRINKYNDLIINLTTYFPENRIPNIDEALSCLSSVTKQKLISDVKDFNKDQLRSFYDKYSEIEVLKDEHVELSKKTDVLLVEEASMITDAGPMDLGLLPEDEEMSGVYISNEIPGSEDADKEDDDTKRTSKQELKEHFKIIKKAMSTASAQFHPLRFAIMFFSVFILVFAFGFGAYKQFQNKEVLSQEIINQMLLSESKTREMEAMRMKLKAISMYKEKLEILEKGTAKPKTRKEQGDSLAQSLFSADSIEPAKKVAHGLISSDSKCPINMSFVNYKEKKFCIDKLEFPNLIDQYPTFNVSFNEAINLCETLGKRICSKDEWIGACSGSSGKAYCVDKPSVQPVCNLKGSGSDDVIRRSGSMKKCSNNIGLLDLNGNLAEWVSDDEKAILLGGSFNDTKKSLSFAKAEEFYPSYKDLNTGFRCCL
ncbi:MAG: SUMF1/EgtB/PvdO family nonheme iron enzyme [Pseudomonadota bacterium]